MDPGASSVTPAASTMAAADPAETSPELEIDSTLVVLGNMLFAEVASDVQLGLEGLVQAKGSPDVARWLLRTCASERLVRLTDMTSMNSDVNSLSAGGFHGSCMHACTHA